MELATAEDTAGVTIARLQDPEKPQLKLLGALSWVHARRSNPKLTYAAFMETADMVELIEFAFPSEEEDPEDPGPVEEGGDPFPGGPDDPGAEGTEQGAVLSADGDSPE